jgi:hypothetical protein
MTRHTKNPITSRLKVSPTRRIHGHGNDSWQTDRILVAFGIIRHAQDPNELNGQGLDKLEKVLSKQELLNDTDSAAKNVYRHNLLENFFELARAEQQVRNGERGMRLHMIYSSSPIY